MYFNNEDQIEEIVDPTPAAPAVAAPIASMPPEQWPNYLTIRDVADILRVSTITLKRWGKRGKLVPIRINQRGDRRYKKEAVLWLMGEMFKK